jgi:hypothetical protein
MRLHSTCNAIFNMAAHSQVTQPTFERGKQRFSQMSERLISCAPLHGAAYKTAYNDTTQQTCSHCHTAQTVPFPRKTISIGSIDTYPSIGSHSTPVGESLESCLLTMTPSSPLTAHTIPFPDDTCKSDS